MQVVGVDGCRAGWVAVRLDADRRVTVLLATTFAQIKAACPGVAAIGVDMPLGLVEEGWRDADVLAAARLGRYRSRLFMVPPRGAWDAPSYRDAVAACRRLTDPPAGFSRQAWALKSKLVQANRAYADSPGHMFEVHPEISFAELDGGLPVRAGKKTWNGQMTRRALLRRAGIVLPDRLGEAGDGAGADDVLDATAAAWSAGRIAAGLAGSYPSPPQLSSEGLPIAIWY